MKRLLLLVLSMALMLSCAEKEPENIPGRGDWTETPDKEDDKNDEGSEEGDNTGNGDNSGNEDNTGSGDSSGNEGGNSGGEGGNKDEVKPVAPVVVVPTVESGSASDDISNMKLTPGKLIGFNQMTNSVCGRAVSAGMYIDIMLNDGQVFNITDEALENLFKSAADAANSTKVKIWGMHLPYKDSVKLQYADESKRLMSVKRQKKLMELSMKYLKPNHFVTHPGSGNYYTHEGDRYNTAKAQVQKSLLEMQQALDGMNSKYGTNTILCVENGSRTVAYDAESLLSLLSAPGLEKVMICLDTGHAISPLNGEYRDKDTQKSVKDGDVVAMLRQIGTRLGTLHIQQCHSGVGKSSPKDEHIVPWLGGLIDWGLFYEVLLKDCLYRGCFLYEVTYETQYEGAKASIESSKSNYDKVIYPAYKEHISK